MEAKSTHYHHGPEPALVFIHGWCCDADDWLEQTSHFSGRHELLAVDLPGHGQAAESSVGDGRMATLGQALCQSLNTLESNTLILIGHSMGGPVALEAAQQSHKTVTAVILVDSFLMDYGNLDENTINTLCQSCDADFDGFIRKLVENSSGSNTSEGLKLAIGEKMIASDPDTALRLWRKLLEWAPSPALAACPAPIFAINSPLIPTATRERLTPQVEDVLIPGAGHFLHRERPALFNQALASMIAKTLGGGTAKTDK